MTESSSESPTPAGEEAEASLIETRLRGDALDGAETKSSVDHSGYEESRNPDAELRLDGEDESLYGDGLDVRGDTDSWAGTDGDAPKGIKG
jgi:hypothetical protein